MVHLGESYCAIMQQEKGGNNSMLWKDYLKHEAYLENK